jgi:hypothetical protein
VIERGRGFGFSHDTLHASTIRGHVGRQNLQRHLPIELRILGEIHLTHAGGRVGRILIEY